MVSEHKRKIEKRIWDFQEVSSRRERVRIKLKHRDLTDRVLGGTCLTYKLFIDMLISVSSRIRLSRKIYFLVKDTRVIQQVLLL